MNGSHFPIPGVASPREGGGGAPARTRLRFNFSRDIEGFANLALKRRVGPYFFAIGQRLGSPSFEPAQGPGSRDELDCESMKAFLAWP